MTQNQRAGIVIPSVSGNSCSAFLLPRLTTVFPLVLGAIGHTATFVLLGAFNFAFIFFTMMYVPETKGISLEGIEKNLMAGKKLRNLGDAS